MNSTRITSFVVCLSLACLVLTGTALASKTTATEVTYAREVGALNAVYTTPAGNIVTRAMTVLRQAASGNFFLRLTLSGNAEFEAAGLPVAGDLTQTAGTPASNITVTIPTAVADGDTSVEFSIVVVADFTVFPTFTIDTGAWRIRDVDNVLGGGGAIQATIITRDANTGNIVDSGTDADDWLKSKFAVEIDKAIAATTAVVDVATNRKNFVDTPEDDIKVDNGASVGIDGSVAGVLLKDATAYTLLAGDSVELVITGDLSGITTISWDGNSKSVTSAEVTANSTTIKIAGTNASLTGSGAGKPFVITVDGTTVLGERTLTLTVNLKLSGGVTGPAANDRTLGGPSTLTVWTLNGTVLIANFQNGNSGIFASRMYIFNSSSSAGAITARVWTLPVAGGTESLLGSVALGTVGAGAGRNIKLAEDILANITGVTVPYTADGGNVVVELTIEASKVTGVGQVFNASTLASFGIFPMQKP